MIKKYYKYDYYEAVDGAAANPEYGKPRFFLKVTWDDEGRKEMIFWFNRTKGITTKEARNLVDKDGCIEMSFEYFDPWYQEINVFRTNFSSHVTIKFWCEEEIIGETDHFPIAY